MKPGDIIRNGWAGKSNPLRITLFLSMTKDRINVLEYYGGKFSKGQYYRSDFEKNDGRFEIIGHCDEYDALKNAILNLNRNEREQPEPAHEAKGDTDED